MTEPWGETQAQKIARLEKEIERLEKELEKARWEYGKSFYGGYEDTR